MDYFSEAAIAAVKQCAFTRITGDQLVSRQAALVFGVWLVAGSGGAATAAVYDGESTNDDRKIDLSCVATGHDNKRYNPPAYFEKGIYVDVGSNVTSVVVQWMSAEG